MKSVNDAPSGKPVKSAAPQKPAAPVNGWRRWMPVVVTAIFSLWVFSAVRQKPDSSPFKVRDFGKLPVVLEGRVQPMDSVARNTLLLMRGKSTVLIEPDAQTPGGRKQSMPAMDWLLEAMTRPDVADTRKIFRLDNSELKSMLKLDVEEKHFSFAEITKDEAAFESFRKEAQRIGEAEEAGTLAAEQRSAFEKSVVRLQISFMTFVRLKSSLQPENAENFAEEVALYDRSIPGGVAAIREDRAAESGEVAVLAQANRKFERLEQIAYPMIIPPADPSNKDGWQNIGAALRDAMRSGGVREPAKAYAKMATAYAKNQPDAFNTALAEYRDGHLKGKYDAELKKGREESFFNHFEFFIKATTVYLVGFLFACAYWNSFTPSWRITGYYLTVLGLLVHTTGLIFRMHLEGRPPVTNLYSSAVFVGFGAVLLGVVLERIFKNAIPLLMATFVGAMTLVIAHNLSLDGDTMKLLQAVLDTNIWLATHVVTITLGYSAMFVAGILGVIFVILGLFTRNLSADLSRNLTRMVYGIICFATFFSFIGTVLGGIWADQSWGRFWGWDPKENGALLIVIWCAVILHARWGGMIRERGLMAMSIFGNVITAFSWFGVNMLGVGLHAYGFMDKAFPWLIGFMFSQLVLIGMALLPKDWWRSPLFGGPSTTATPRVEQRPTPENEFAAAQKIAPPKPAN